MAFLEDPFDLLTIFFALLVLLAIAGGLICICYKCLQTKRHRNNRLAPTSVENGGENAEPEKCQEQQQRQGQKDNFDEKDHDSLNGMPKSEIGNQQNHVWRTNNAAEDGGVNVESIAGVVLVRPCVSNTDSYRNSSSADHILHRQMKMELNTTSEEDEEEPVDHEMEGGSRYPSSRSGSESSRSTTIFRNADEENHRRQLEHPQSRAEEFKSTVLLDEPSKNNDDKNTGGDEDDASRSTAEDQQKNEKGTEEVPVPKLTGAAKIEQELIGMSDQQLPEDIGAELEKKEELKKAIGPPEPNLE